MESRRRGSPPLHFTFLIVLSFTVEEARGGAGDGARLAVVEDPAEERSRVNKHGEERDGSFWWARVFRGIPCVTVPRAAATSRRTGRSGLRTDYLEFIGNASNSMRYVCIYHRLRTHSVTQQSSAPRSGENREHPTPPHEPHPATQHTFPLADATPDMPLPHVVSAARRSRVGSSVIRQVGYLSTNDTNIGSTLQ